MINCYVVDYFNYFQSYESQLGDVMERCMCAKKFSLFLPLISSLSMHFQYSSILLLLHMRDGALFLLVLA